MLFVLENESNTATAPTTNLYYIRVSNMYLIFQQSVLPATFCRVEKGVWIYLEIEVGFVWNS